MIEPPLGTRSTERWAQQGGGGRTKLRRTQHGSGGRNTGVEGAASYAPTDADRTRTAMSSLAPLPSRTVQRETVSSEVVGLTACAISHCFLVILSGHHRPTTATSRREGSQDDGLDTGCQGPRRPTPLHTSVTGLSGRSLRPSSPGMGRWCGLRDDKVRCRVAQTCRSGMLLGNGPPMHSLR